MPIRVMLDNGILIHSEFAEGAVKEGPTRWGPAEHLSRIHGVIRKNPSQNADYQAQKDSLFTVGRMIRENRIEAYTYTELSFEKARGTMEMSRFNALRGCTIRNCPPALERSRFRRTSNFEDYIAKGGKKDRTAMVPLDGANQIAFMEWLCTLTGDAVIAIIAAGQQLGLNEFEIGSLQGLDWFQLLCSRSGSPENFPDVFHLWTAERNCLDVFLTLEKKLPNLVSRVRNEKRGDVKMGADVLRPRELLQRLGITKPDPVPMDPDQFYSLL